MKLLRTNVRVNPRDSMGQGLDASITLVLFFALGFIADRWLGTTPWLMIALTLLAAVGLFYRLRTAYYDRMDQHEAERVARAAARTGEPAPGVRAADAPGAGSS